MNEKSSIYLVRSSDDHQIDDVLAYFSSKDQADYFLMCYNKATPLIIEEKPLDLHFGHFPEKHNYYVILGMISDIPYENYIYTLTASNAAKGLESYELEFDSLLPVDRGIIEIYVYAYNAAEALRRAIGIRNQVVLLGEWHNAYLKKMKYRTFD